MFFWSCDVGFFSTVCIDFIKDSEDEIIGKIDTVLCKKSPLAFLSSNTSNETLLHGLAEQGYAKAFNHLKGRALFDINAQDFAGRTSLYLAAEYGHDEMVKDLVDWGAKTYLTEKDWGRTPLHIAAENGHLDVCRLLLEADVNGGFTRKKGKHLYLDKDKNGDTALTLAIFEKNYDVVRLLIDYGANPYQPVRGFNDSDAFYFAKDDEKMIRILKNAETSGVQRPCRIVSSDKNLDKNLSIAFKVNTHE